MNTHSVPVDTPVPIDTQTKALGEALIRYRIWQLHRIQLKEQRRKERKSKHAACADSGTHPKL